MKVLKEGKWHVPWSMEMVCPESSCDATLLVEEVDLKPVDNGTGYYSICAVCGHHVPVPAKDLPLRVKEVLDKKRKYSNYYD